MLTALVFLGTFTLGGIVGKKTNNVIRIIGDINEDAYAKFSSELAELEHGYEGVSIELSSHGGSSYVALAFAARIRLSPADIDITAYGFVASAAVLILAVGDYRKITEESWVMVHEDSDKLNGNVVELEREAAHLRRMETQWADLLEDCTHTPAATWTLLHKQTSYLTPIECLTYSLVDEII